MTLSEFYLIHISNTLIYLVFFPRTGCLGLHIIMYMYVAEGKQRTSSIWTLHHKIKSTDQTSGIVHNIHRPHKQILHSKTHVGQITISMSPETWVSGIINPILTIL